MTGPVRAVIFGNGFARTTMLPCLRQVPQLEVVGLASPSLERARATAAEFAIPEVSSDYREILSRCAPELVFVVTPPHRHLEMTLDALAAGCHVVCEKPTAMNQGESLRMMEAASALPGRLALIDHELRFDPRRRLLRERVLAGGLGTILRASYTLYSFGRRDPDSPWSWWSDREQGGGAWGAIGSHAIDTLRSMLGEIDEVRGHLATHVRERKDPRTGQPVLVTSDDAAYAWLRFRSGAEASIQISLVEGERRHELQLAGTEGAARWEEHRPLLFAAGGEAGRQGWREHDVPEDLPPSQEMGIPDTDWARCFLRLSRRIALGLREGQPLDGAATFTDGHRNQQVLDAARRSHETAHWAPVGGDTLSRGFAATRD